MNNSEIILVCLSGAPTNARVVKTAAALADACGGRLCGVYIEPPDFERQSEESKLRLGENIKLTEMHGGAVTTLYGEDAATQIAEYARLSGATKIVLGKGKPGRGIFSHGALIDRLNELCPDIDLYIIPDRAGEAKPLNKLYSDEQLSLKSTVLTLGILLLCTFIGWLFVRLGFSTANVIMIYILGVLATAIFTEGRAYSLISSVLSVLVFNFFFTEPRFSLFADPSHIATFVVMFIAAFIISSLTVRIKRQSRLTAQRAYRTELLLEASQKLQRCSDIPGMLSLTAGQLSKLLERSIILYPVENGALSEPVAFPLNPASDCGGLLTDRERAVAQKALESSRQAGYMTKSEPDARGLYMAIRGSERVVAVVCIDMRDRKPLGRFEKTLAVAVLDECGLITENAIVVQARRDAEEKARREELRANLLRSISHDLRTPLTGISGAADLLSENGNELSEDKKRELLSAIGDDARWLIDLVENLLSVTRIGAGGGMSIEPQLVSEVISEALRHIDRRASSHSICVDCPDGLLMAQMDARLISQVIINLVNNAIKHTAESSKIVISAKRNGDIALISVADDGQGIPPGSGEKIFDMFYTEGSAVRDGRRGLGLGLFLCRSIVEAHGGSISEHDNIPHGSVFEFSLPVSEVTDCEQTADIDR